MAKSLNKLNVQGMARRDKGLMLCVVPDKGWTTVSIDLSAGEPTVTSHFSRDPNYCYACFDGVGKAPFYKDGVLMIDDVYIMCASISPVGKDLIREAFNKTWPAGSFAQQWLQDAELIKKSLKQVRTLHKLMALAIAYGCGAKKIVKLLYENGFIISLEDATQFRKLYWHLFIGVKQFAKRIEKQVEKDGYIINPFGYRLTPETFKAYNAYIQSSVSGIMHVFTAKLMAAAPYARWTALIHDELLVDVPDSMLEQFKKDKDLATESLNEDLGWSVKIRTGFAPGKTWYEAK